MDRNFKRSLQLVLKYEGGWADHPKDPGGATMKGVTLANFRKFVKPNATKEDLRKITNDQVSIVYRRHYWDVVLGSELPDGLDFCVFDFAVNSGPNRAAKYLQALLGVKQDGKIGNATRDAAKAADQTKLINDYCDKRMAFLKRLKTFPTFGKGWAARVTNVRANALAISKAPTPDKPTIITEEVVVEKKVETPVVPTTVDKQVKEKTNAGSVLLASSGILTTAGTWISGAAWQNIAVVAGAALVSMLLLFILRRWIISGIKEIRGAIEE